MLLHLNQLEIYKSSHSKIKGTTYHIFTLGKYLCFCSTTIILVGVFFTTFALDLIEGFSLRVNYIRVMMLVLINELIILVKLVIRCLIHGYLLVNYTPDLSTLLLIIYVNNFYLIYCWLQGKKWSKIVISMMILELAL